MRGDCRGLILYPGEPDSTSGFSRWPGEAVPSLVRPPLFGGCSVEIGTFSMPCVGVQHPSKLFPIRCRCQALSLPGLQPADDYKSLRDDPLLHAFTAACRYTHEPATLLERLTKQLEGQGAFAHPIPGACSSNVASCGRCLLGCWR